MTAARSLLILALCAAVHASPSGGARPVDEPTRQVFDISKEAGAPTFLVVQLPRGYWRRPDLTGWGRPRTTLGRGAEFKRVPLASGPNENGGVTVEYKARGNESLHDAVDAVYAAWRKSARNVSPQPDEHKRRTVKVKNATLKAVIWRWSSEHIMTGQPITTTSAACEVGQAVVVLTGWELDDAGGARRRGTQARPGRAAVSNFSTAGIFEDLLRAVSVARKRPKPQPVRFKLSDTHTNARYYLTGLLPPGLEQGGGPFPAGSSTCAFRHDDDGNVQARFRVTVRRMTKGSQHDEVEYVLRFVREKYTEVAEPRNVRAGGVPCVLLGYRNEQETVRTALFFADGRIWTWSFLSTMKGEELEKDLAAFEKQVLKSARIWWANRK